MRMSMSSIFSSPFSARLFPASFYGKVSWGCASFHSPTGSTILAARQQEVRGRGSVDRAPRGYGMDSLRIGGRAAALVAALALPAAAAHAEEWPSRAVKIVVAFAPGG